MNFDKPQETSKDSALGKYKQGISDQITKLTSKRVSLKDVANLLGAQAFLTFDERNQSWKFNAKGFIDQSAQNHSFIKLPDNITILAETILPPQEGETIMTGSGAGMEKKEIIPRSRYLMEVLAEMNLSYEVIEGTNDPKMMRQLSYQAFIIKSADKIVFINDEEGNATFVVFNAPADLEEVKKVLALKKDELRGQPNVETIIYPGDSEKWKDEMKAVLQQDEPIEKEIITPLQAKLSPRRIPYGFWRSASIKEIEVEISKRGLDPKNLPGHHKLAEKHNDLIQGLKKRFGNISEIRKIFGGSTLRTPTNYWKDLSEKELLDEIRKRGLDPANLPSSVVMRKENGNLLYGLLSRFGDFNQTRKALGSKILHRPNGFWLKASDEEMVEEIKKAGLDPKNLPVVSDFRKEYGYLLGAIRQKYGGLSQAREILRGYKETEGIKE